MLLNSPNFGIALLILADYFSWVFFAFEFHLLCPSVPRNSNSFVQMNDHASLSSVPLSVAIQLPPEPIIMAVQAKRANLLILAYCVTPIFN